MVKDMVSIIVPVYNVEKYLDYCVESIVSQTYKNLEIILVDDGATDNSGKICDLWKEKDERIIVIHKENGGLSDARNAGMEIMKGEFVTFVDSDDAIDKDYVEKLHNALISQNVCMVGSRYYVNDIQTGEIKRPSKDDRYVFKTDTKNFMKKVYNNCYMVTAWGKMAYATVYKDIRFPKGRTHEDAFTIRKIAYNCKKIAWIDEAMYFYRQRPQSIMSSMNDKTYRDDFAWIKEDVDYYKSVGETELEAEAKKLFSHNFFAYRKKISKELKKEVRGLNKKYIKDTVKWKKFSKKTRLKYFILGLLT